MSLALVLAIFIGILWPLNVESRELLARTHVGLDSAVLALALGVAAGLILDIWGHKYSCVIYGCC